jgi:hypothetical protein
MISEHMAVQEEDKMAASRRPHNPNLLRNLHRNLPRSRKTRTQKTEGRKKNQSKKKKKRKRKKRP